MIPDQTPSGHDAPTALGTTLRLAGGLFLVCLILTAGAHLWGVEILDGPTTGRILISFVLVVALAFAVTILVAPLRRRK